MPHVGGVPFYLKGCLTTRYMKSGEISLEMLFHGLIYLLAWMFGLMLLFTYGTRKMR